MSLTARRERQPSGRSNLSSARLSVHSPPTPQEKAIISFPMTDSLVSMSTSLDSASLSLFRRKKAMQMMERAKISDARSAALGKYNEHSVPRVSKISPLRTVFLDPEVNNFNKSQTRSELMERIRKSGLPDISYDIDGDGFVSQEDYKTSKTYDLDCSGILDTEEQRVGFETSAALRALEAIRRKKEMTDCLGASSAHNVLLQHNYYTNKFDPSGIDIKFLFKRILLLKVLVCSVE